MTGGEGGIRTPGTLSGTPVFKTGAINHSATSPGAIDDAILRGIPEHYTVRLSKTCHAIPTLLVSLQQGEAFHDTLAGRIHWNEIP